MLTPKEILADLFEDLLVDLEFNEAMRPEKWADAVISRLRDAGFKIVAADA